LFGGGVGTPKGAFYYFSTAIPRLLTGHTVLLLVFFFGSNWRATYRRFELVVIPTFYFLVLYSIHPDKEVRYLYPIYPSLLLMAAEGFRKCTDFLSKSTLVNVVLLIVGFASVIASFGWLSVNLYI
jgi:uncharacterized membrane protein